MAAVHHGLTVISSFPCPNFGSKMVSSCRRSRLEFWLFNIRIKSQKNWGISLPLLKDLIHLQEASVLVRRRLLNAYFRQRCPFWHHWPPKPVPLMKMSHLSFAFQSPIHAHASAICIQGPSLNLDIGNSLQSVNSFRHHRPGRCSYKKAGSIVTKCIIHLWSSGSEMTYTRSVNGIDCHPTQRRPRFSCHTSTIMKNQFIVCFLNLSRILHKSLTFVALIVPPLEDSLHIILADFNHASTLSLTVLDMTNLPISLNRSKSLLEELLTIALI